MTPMRDWHLTLEKWCPLVIMLLLLGIALTIPRLLVLLLLPPDASREWHPLHKVHDFVVFD